MTLKWPTWPKVGDAINMPAGTWVELDTPFGAFLVYVGGSPTIITKVRPKG